MYIQSYNILNSSNLILSMIWSIFKRPLKKSHFIETPKKPQAAPRGGGAAQPPKGQRKITEWLRLQHFATKKNFPLIPLVRWFAPRFWRLPLLAPSNMNVWSRLCTPAGGGGPVALMLLHQMKGYVCKNILK